jgi:uncharacterized phage protein gp47/JayE
LPFNRPPFATIEARVKTDSQGELEGTAAFYRRSFERANANALAGVSHQLHGHLAWIARQLDPRSADADMLEKIHGEPYGVFRKPAVAAQLTISVTGTEGSVVEASAQWKRSDGAIYIVDADVVVGDSATSVAVTAEAPGADSSTGNGAEFQLDGVILGVDGTATVTATTREGSDLEDIEDYRTRVIERRQHPLRGGAPGDYRTWTLEVPGVTRAWEFPRQEGAGTVSIFGVNDAAYPDPITLSGPKLTEIATYLEQPGRAPSTAELFIYTPTLQDLGLEINLSPNTTPVQNAVAASVQAFLKRVGTPEGMTVILSQLNEAISQATGEFDHELVSPVANVVIPFGSLPTAGEPAFGPL